MVLPTDYKDKLGKLNTIREMEFDLTNQERIHGEVCGPVRIQLKGFVPTYTEVLFADVKDPNGIYQPLLAQ